MCSNSVIFHFSKIQLLDLICIRFKLPMVNFIQFISIVYSILAVAYIKVVSLDELAKNHINIHDKV